ncbi:MAG: TIGR03790 family protein [Terriglobales bacterium]
MLTAGLGNAKALSWWAGLAGFLFLACPLLAAQQAREGLADRVLVVFNSKVKASRQVAEFYAQARGIPSSHLCAIARTNFEPYDGTSVIPWEDFESKIAKPIRKCLERVGKTRILYVVFTYGTPYKLQAVPRGYGISLDQYVADIWKEMGPASRAVNPYYAHARSKEGQYTAMQSLAEYRERPGSKTIYSVWRLDAPSAELAKGLVRKGLEAEEHGLQGQGCFDRRFGPIEKVNDAGYGAGDWDVFRAAEAVRAAEFPVTEDAHGQEFGTAPAPARCENAAFYAGWYSLDHYNDAFSWRPGAIGIHLDSASAANPRGGTNWSANAVSQGITITAGALREPDLLGLPHPDGVFRDVLAGGNVGDAFLRNTRWLSWMILQVGDPLYRPFPNGRPNHP